MEFENPFDLIWRVYEVTKDCLKVAQRTVRGRDDHLLRETEFIGTSVPVSMEWIATSRNESDDFVVMSLWVIFERIIISYLQEKGRRILEAQPASFSKRLYNKFETEVEYWRIEDVLDLFKSGIDPALIGDAKNIKKYRDWIAHRNPNRKSPPKVDPLFAYRILSEILAHIQVYEHE